MSSSGWRNWSDHPVTVTLGVIAAMVTIVVGIVTLWPKDGTPDSMQESSLAHDARSTVEWRLPEQVALSSYEAQLPILDSTLYVGRYYTSLVLGGVNLHQIALAARSKLGAEVRIEWDNYHKWLTLPYSDEPVIEIRYASSYFRLETALVGESFTPAITMHRVPEPSMELRQATSYVPERSPLDAK